MSTRAFGDCQLHVEWATPAPPRGEGQDRGNSGGNASRPPGEWQEYDIVFRRPRFDGDGRLVRPARITVFHNRVLVHDNVELAGATAHRERASYAAHPDRLPLLLQDHGSPGRYRNIWVRELPEP